MTDNATEWIATRAYALWELAGRPFGADEMHWQQAVLERRLLEETKASTDGQEVIERTRADPLRAQSSSNILVVEDEPILRYDTVDFLERAGHRVLEAANADEAMVFLRRNDIDTLFTDIDMPGSMDGLGLVKRVRADWPSTKVIVTSGLIALSHDDLETGVSFISKPASRLELLKLIA
ncbi:MULTISPECIES: response regulator [Rhizobium]|uniref:Response regulator n=1 Tax=Rhizobium changzhiense TaxID=2692317 RepID=A0ABR6A1N6_9HYPH|nr:MULTISPECIES: response regulator [Rhizobium]MBA5800466.1 response regulator [Rhizobium changzhiense]MCW0019089.1 response regulator [Rhizobium sp. BT-226]NNU48875.1 response regulator [Rhizobium changzhiense]